MSTSQNVWIKLFDFSSVHERKNEYDYYNLTSIWPMKFQYKLFYPLCFSFGKIVACYTTFFKLHIPLMGQSPSDLQLQLLFTPWEFFTSVLIVIIIIIFKLVMIFFNDFHIMCVNYFSKLFVLEKLIFKVFLLNILCNISDWISGYLLILKNIFLCLY